MKVIKVIVNELPETCMKCNHCYDNTCEITFKRLTGIRFDARPDWCPLIVEGEVFNWIMHRPPTPIECGDPQ